MTRARRARGMLLFPGAGSDSNHPSLVAIEHAVAPLPVRRADFAYRLAGKRAPDRAPVLLETVRAAASELAQACATTTAELVLGGRSMGGRMCSMVVAGDGEPMGPPAGLAAAGLVLIAYPLHPPGRPDTLRVEHLDRLDLPCLFVSGTRDPFGTPEELLRWTSTIPGPTTHVWMDGRGHDLRGCDQAIATAVSGWLSDSGLATPPRPRRPRGIATASPRPPSGAGAPGSGRRGPGGPSRGSG